MADYTATVPINYQNSWADSTGTYLTATITANITVTIPEDYTQIICTLSDYNQSFTQGSATGGGFINIGGIAWNVGEFSQRTTMTDVSSDSFDSAWNQLLTACPELEEQMIVGIAVRDSDGQRETRQGTSWNTWTFNVSGRDEIEQGVVLVNGFNRSWDSSTDPATAWVASYSGYTITIGGDDSDIPLPYYPFAVYISDTWQSCDRDGGSLTRYDGSAWADLQNNSLSDDADDNTVFNYDGSAWNKAPLIGET